MLLKLDLVQVTIERSPAEVLSYIQDLVTFYISSPIVITNLLLQIEWLMLYFHNQRDFVKNLFELQTYTWNLLKSKNPIVYSFFNHFISLKSAKVLGKILPQFAGATIELFESADMFDAIEYFAHISYEEQTAFAPRAFFIATLLLGTNLKVYQEKNDLNNYYFTLSKLCSLNITANETSSLEFLMDEFKLLDLQEPLNLFHLTLNRDLFPNIPSLLTPKSPLLSSPLFLRPVSGNFDVSVGEIFLFSEQGVLLLAEKGFSTVVTALCKLILVRQKDSKSCEGGHALTLDYLASLFNPSLLKMSPEESFEIFKRHLYKDVLRNVNSQSNLKAISKASKAIFGVDNSNFPSLKRMCLTFLQILYLKYGNLVYLDKVANYYKPAYIGFCKSLYSLPPNDLIEALISRMNIKEVTFDNLLCFSNFITIYMSDSLVDTNSRVDLQDMQLLLDLLFHMFRIHGLSTFLIFKFISGHFPDLKFSPYDQKLYPQPLIRNPSENPKNFNPKLELIYKFVTNESFIYVNENPQSNVEKLISNIVQD